MAKKVITFGEIMLRLAPEGYYRFVQADTYGATYGGGEANVAVSLANYGFDAKFVTKLPKHEIGQAAVNSLQKIWCRYNLHRTRRRPSRYLLPGERRFPDDRPRLFMTVQVPLSQLHDASDFNWKEIFDGR